MNWESSPEFNGIYLPCSGVGSDWRYENGDKIGYINKRSPLTKEKEHEAIMSTAEMLWGVKLPRETTPPKEAYVIKEIYMNEKEQE